MARHASTYRQARRAEYRSLVANGLTMNWVQYNEPKRVAGLHGSVWVGSVQDPERINKAPKPSKYMPHIGAKQRAKGLARSA